MRTILSWLTACLFCMQVQAQQITAAEYFVDADPGVGQATAFGVTAGDTANSSFTIDGTGIPVGFHTLAIRFRDAAGRWGHAASRLFYVYSGSGGSGTPAPPVTAGEYFVDADPGLGQATAFGVTAGDTANGSFTIDGTGIPVGFHTLAIRFRDAAGRWGHAASRLFYVYGGSGGSGTPAPPITAAEYFFDTDPGIGNGTALPTGAPQDSVSLNTVIDASALAVGAHMLCIRFRDQEGRWGHASAEAFVVLVPGALQNDECLAATALVLQPYGACPANGTAGSTEEATWSGTTGCWGQYNDVWYKVNSGNSPEITLDLTPVSAADLRVEVMDACNGTVIQCISSYPYTFSATLNTTYWLRVYGAGADGSFGICASAAAEDCLGEVGGPHVVGTSCDDGEGSTNNDQYQPNCECHGWDCAGVLGGAAGPGTPCDYYTVGDGVYDANCICTYPVDCQGVAGGPALPGVACDDGLASTTGDAWTVNCACTGYDCLGIAGGSTGPGSPCNYYTFGDGVYDANCICTYPVDCQGVAGGPALPGVACDDGLASTTGDAWTVNCACTGYDCLGIAGGSTGPGSPCNNYTVGDGVYDANCVCTYPVDCQGVAGGPALPGVACDDGLASTTDDAWTVNCACTGYDCLGIAGGSTGPGSPCNYYTVGDGVYDANCSCLWIDCEGVPGGSATVGTSCDDGNPNTGGDIYDANCVCAGQTVDCEGVPGGSATIGTACDDGNASTGNDVYGANCVCAGQLIDCEGVPGGSATIGTSCDDGNASTGNDVYDANCVCAGQVIDCEGVPGGSATIGTTCDDGNASTGNDVYDVNCFCTGQLIDCEGVPGGSATVGTSCDDGNPNTGGDIYDANCVCTGQTVDCEGVPGGSATIGTACDDGNASTGNDVYDVICVCAGQPIDCEGVPGGSATIGTACDDGNPNTGGDIYDANCVCVGQTVDCEGVPGGSATIGTACDDGNASTGNDVYDVNCVCAGQLIDCEGVPGGSATIGTSCDDGNASTGNDVYDANCVCTGQLIDCEGVPGGSATIGMACDDGNASTGNDVYDANCVCTGQLIDCEGVPGGSATIGTTCDDGNASTGNDVYDVNCVCTGQLIDCEGVPGGSATVGTSCDDGNANTGGDIYDANCVCAGQTVDCQGVPGGSATIGTACDDGNASTGNDVYDANCVCAGQLIDCEGVPGGSATVGTSCDDGNASTGNDVYDVNCVCAGQLIDCEGMTGGSALPGTPCDDGDVNTGNDTWTAECGCTGSPIGGPCTGDQVVLIINTDNNPGDIGWEILDGGNNVVASGSPSTANAQNSTTVCLGSAPNACYGLRLTDSYGDGISGGGWALRTTDGKLILGDVFSDGTVSPSAMPLSPSYGNAHSFCLPLGPANILDNECGTFNNDLGNKVYCNKVTGATQYQFEFSDPDAGRIRRIVRSTNYVHFSDMVANPLVPGVKYFARVRTNVDGPVADAHFGSGCEMGLAPLSVCSQLIQAPAYGHSCNETRTFNTNNSFIYAKPVVGATEYQFRIFNIGEGYDQTFTRSTYILQLKWNANVAPPLVNGSTYSVEVNVKVSGVFSGFCPSSCNITINNGGNSGLMAGTEHEGFGDAMLWPNPVRDGQVNLDLTGLKDKDQRITLDIQDIYGNLVFTQAFANNGARFSTVLQLPGDIASGVYLVNITVNGEHTVQRLSIIR